MTEPWGRRLFATGAIVLLLLGVVHSISLFAKMTPTNDTEKQLLDLMSNYKFDLMGSPRSMDNLLRGFSLTFMLAVMGLGALDLLLVREYALLKRLALFNVLWLGAMVVVSLRFFFAAPTSFLIATFAIFTASWLKLPASSS